MIGAPQRHTGSRYHSIFEPRRTSNWNIPAYERCPAGSGSLPLDSKGLSDRFDNLKRLRGRTRAKEPEGRIAQCLFFVHFGEEK